jgi:CBS domain-containing protein
MKTQVQTHPLIAISCEAPVQDAARLMVDCRIGALGVLDATKQFAGIVTERDLTRFLALNRDAAETPVSTIVKGLPVVVNGPIEEADALEQMHRARIRHLIVHVGDEFHVVSMRDLVLNANGSTTAEPVARDLMTVPAVGCRDEAVLDEIAEILADRDISGMPVVDAIGDVVGVISERDLAHALGGPMVRLAVRRRNHGSHRSRTAGTPWGQRRAKDVMSSPALTVSPQTKLEELARLMRVNQINRVPVVDGGRLLGVVTRGDVLGAMAHLNHASTGSQRAVLVGSGGMHPEIG